MELINWFTVMVPFLCAMLLSWGMMPYIILISFKKRLFDPIDSRKLHQNAIPRLGGVAFAPIQCCVLIATLVCLYKLNIGGIDLHVASWIILPSMALLLCGLFILFMVGIADDLIGVDYKWKFVAQIMVASLLPLSGIWINDLYGLGLIVSLPAWFGMPLTVFVVVLIINAINLIDGLDGLCSGVVAIGVAVLGILFALHGAWLHAIFAFITVAVLVPFFYFNVFGTSRRRRRIFMGDTGSMTLGFSIAFLVISFAMNNHHIKLFTEGSIVIAFSTLIVPLLDVARVMYIRWRQDKPVFKPDRNHLHHKLLRAGLSRHSALLFILVLTVLFCLFNITAVRYLNNNLVLLMDLFLWLGFHRMFNVLEKKRLINRLQLFINL
ncbi:MraY family glycosyltransferase [Sphingobacterium kitahiroshimense]|uniref:MraY family glycosyltransferase n=1 Tax=Sphingobacterium kitahiroshimense TaxID=470446 RepID=A0ABV0BWL8_9SPHI